MDPSFFIGIALTEQHFIGQSAHDIRHNLQNLQMGHQTNQNVLLDTAFMVYNSWDLKQEKRKQNKKKRQAKIITVNNWQNPWYPKDI